MSDPRCEKFKCTQSNVPDCEHCSYEFVCPYACTCSLCLYGMPSDFIACPHKPFTNFTRENVG